MSAAVKKNEAFVETEQIARAYEYCREVTRRHAKSFYFAAKFLPVAKRPAIYAVYALCRHVDDAVDESGIASADAATAAVNEWKAKLDAVYQENLESGMPSAEFEKDSAFGGDHSSSVLLAWRDLLKTYKIPQNLPLELMQGVLMDTHIKRYETFEELYVYCYRVASVVGLMSSEIFGYSEPETLDYAEALGIAMQLTNILRDIGEDARMGRIYLPQQDLRRFNVSEQQIAEQKVDDNFLALMRFEVERARSFYGKAERGIRMLDCDARLAVLFAHRLYSRILDEIERQNYDVFVRRAHTNRRQKILSIPRVWLEARNL